MQSIPSARPILAALVVATALGDGASRAAEPYASFAVGATWPFSRSASDAASDYHFSDQFSGGFSGEIGVGVDFGAVRSEPGRLVTIVRRGNSTPMRGHAFRWDLVKGTLAVEGARGTIGR